MEKLITIFTIMMYICLLSCTKDKDNPNPQNPGNPGGGNNNPGNPPQQKKIDHRFIPNWKTDTLFLEDYQSYVYDSIYIGTTNDTSWVIYAGVKYYVWTSSHLPVSNGSWFQPVNMSYSNCYIGLAAFDDSASLSGSWLTSVYPYKYYDSNFSKWKYQKQQLYINPMKPPFPDANGMFVSRKIYEP